MFEEKLEIKIYYQTDKEFHEQAPWLKDIWYGKFVRGYVDLETNEIYINEDAWYRNKDDLRRLILHEIFHILGGEHTKIPGGVGYWSGLLRW